MVTQMLLHSVYSQTYTYTLETNTAYMNIMENLLHNADTDLQECKDKCGSMQDCAGFSIIYGRECYLKTRMGMNNFDPITDSYIKQIIPSATPMTARPIVVQDISPIPSPIANVSPKIEAPTRQTTEINKPEKPSPTGTGIAQSTASVVLSSSSGLAPPSSKKDKSSSSLEKGVPENNYGYSQSSDQTSNSSSHLILILSIVSFLFALLLIVYTIYKHRTKRRQKELHSGRFQSSLFTFPHELERDIGYQLNTSIHSHNAFTKTCISIPESSF